MHTDIVDAPDKGRFRVGRREALQSGAAWTLAVAAPTIVPATALGRAGRAAPSERISLGFLGVGGRGRALLRGFLNCPEAQCLAVCDPYTNRREATAAMIGGRHAEVPAGRRTRWRLDPFRRNRWLGGCPMPTA
jgi:hypothetical protein